MSLRKTEAIISKSSPRYNEWLEVFGTDRIPLVSPIPYTGSVPGISKAEFYKLDPSSLTEDQLMRFVAHISKKFHVSEDLVWHEITSGSPIPILADDVTVALDLMLFI